MTGPVPSHVVVLGGGITGLSSAFHLTRRLPRASKITVIERTNRLGGWIKSHPLHGNNIALEAGPRTLRGGGLALMELINQLNLQPSLLTSSKSSEAARSRYLYMSQHNPPLTKIPPAPVGFLFSSRLRWGLLPFLKEPFKAANRPPDMLDESVESFISRRLTPEFARAFLSAFVHGIFAADARELSMKSLFPLLWRAEELGGGSFLFGMRKAVLEKEEASVKKFKEGNYLTGSVPTELSNVSVFSFRGGMETLTKALEERLIESGNVTILRETGCQHLIDDRQTDGFKVALSTGETLDASHIISTIPLPALHSILHRETPSTPQTTTTTPRLPHLLANSGANVQVLNLIFPPHPTPIHPSGFGYLVPRPKEGGYPTSPTKVTDEGTTEVQNFLGTIFDSALNEKHDHTKDPTVMTVMMGGPYPLIDPPDHPPATRTAECTDAMTSSTTLHTDELAPFLRTLTRHLAPSAPLPLPTTNAFHTHLNCIPTYKPGHVERMKDLADALLDNRGEWRGRLKVVGAGVGGPGVGDCIDGGRKAAYEVTSSLPA